MLNIMKSELYKMIHRRCTYVFLMVFVVGGFFMNLLLKVLLSSVVKVRLGDEIMDFWGEVVVAFTWFIVYMIAQIIYSNESKIGVSKNTISFGISRTKMYVSRFITQLVVLVVATVLVSGSVLLGNLVFNSGCSAARLESFDVLIEIPKGSRNKYEYDFKLKKIRYDRMLFSSMMYPADYGFIPETLALDGDPLDVLVLVHEPTFPGCVIEVKPIGVFHMADEKGPDEKIVCVPISDPIWNKYNDLSDLNPHRIKEIEHFFKVYKDLENKKVDVEGWGDVHEARDIINACVDRFAALENKPEDLFSIK